MKKGLIFLLGIISFFGINKVSAEEKHLEYNTNVNLVKPYIEEIGYEAINNAINKNIEYYNNYLSSEYPYYFISLTSFAVGLDTEESFHIILTAFDNTSSDLGRYFVDSIGTHFLLYSYTYSNYKQIEYNLDTNEISICNYSFELDIFRFGSNYSYYNVYNYYYSNFDLYYKGSLLPNNSNPGTFGYYTYLKPDDTLYVPKLDNSNLYSVNKANTDFFIEPYSLYDDNDSFATEVEKYVSIDLNEYSYVALSLKDYSKTETSYTNMYVKGQLCLTPVYNYGMTEKGEYYSNYQVQRCSSYYNDFTLVRTYILADDLKNNSIFYLKAYDTSKENIVKVNSSIFEITYITEETKDNPYVSIGGKTYPTIAYDKLSSTATKSEDEDYISGVTCQVGDFNCYNEYNPSNVFNDLFDKPLEMLKSVWGAIISIFTLIGEFIALLPPTMQGFLYISFGIAIILGIIKILL